MFGKIFSVAAVLSCLAVSGAENLVPNADFDTMEKWNVNTRPVTLKTYTVKDGMLHGDFVEEVKQKNFVAVSSALPKLEAAVPYVFGAKIRINAAPGKDKKVQFAIREANEKGRTIVYQNIFPLLNKNNEWIEVAKTFTIRKNAVAHQYYIVMSNFEPGDTLDVDYVFVRKKEAVAAAADNPVKNGDFEAGLAQWEYATDRDSASTSIAFDAEKGKVLRLTGDPANRFNNFKTVIGGLDKLPGKTYTLSFDAAAKVTPAKGKACYVRLREINEKGKTIRYAGVAVDFSKTGWQKYEASFALTGRAAGCQIFISTQSLTADEEVKIDNVKLTQK